MEKKIKIPTEDELKIRQLEEELSKAKEVIQAQETRYSLLVNDVTFIMEALEG